MNKIEQAPVPADLLRIKEVAKQEYREFSDEQISAIANRAIPSFVGRSRIVGYTGIDHTVPVPEFSQQELAESSFANFTVKD